MISHRSASLALASSVLLAACAPDAPSVTDVSLKQDKAGAGSGTVMSGLNAPRGLAFGPEGALYVAEAGTNDVSGDCITTPRATICYSNSGSISRLWKGSQTRIISGLPSVNDGQPGGPSHLDFQGRGNGYVTIGLGAPPNERAGLGPRGFTTGTLLRFTPNGAWSVAADVSAFENADPDNDGVDSNPYGVRAEGGVQYVTDAGGNSLLKIVDGVVSLVATFPKQMTPPGFPPRLSQMQAVPTEVRRGPDGALYVSSLTGAPFVPGFARIYRVVEGEAPTVFVGGLTQVTDFAFGPDGSLYVTQFGSAPFFGGQGSLVKIAPSGVRTVLLSTLQAPTGVIVGPDGAVYVTNKGNLIGGGEVLRVAP